MAKQDDGLFLLEVLIDKITFLKSPCFSDKDFRTCVSLSCSSVEPLVICDDDPATCIAKSGGPFVKHFNNGKSCLFSLKNDEINKAMSKFPIQVLVYKSLPCGCLPTKIDLGETTIDMTKEFVQARNKFLEDPNNVSYQALKDSFQLMSDGAEAGTITMFLRISCFGKLIITRFQGSAQPTLKSGGGNEIIDRSCNPKREYQSSADPCACGAAYASGSGRGGRVGPCPTSGYGPCPDPNDPYNSMPCVDEVDYPCYCSGPRPPGREQMACRNTDPYCLHVPKGALPSLPYCEDLSEARKRELRAVCYTKEFFAMHSTPSSQSQELRDLDDLLLGQSSYFSWSSDTLGSESDSNISVKRNDTSSRIINDDTKITNKIKETRTFVYNEIAVYMSLFEEFCRQRTSSTQATASINKCLQVSARAEPLPPDSKSSQFFTTNIVSSMISGAPNKHSMAIGGSSDVYYFQKKPTSNTEGMGITNKKHKRCCASCNSQTGRPGSATGSQTKGKGASASTNTRRNVSIDDKNCPAVDGTKGDLSATVSHIKIAPRDPCPFHGTEPCIGPKCIAAKSEQQNVPVKVTTVNNPRRGVFEMVVRRLNGAPLAKNELMLEWTPPPCRPSPCGPPCLPCPPYPCPPLRCAMVVCRPRCVKKRRRSCSPKPCRGLPCRPCRPCPPICPPSSCCVPPCNVPCYTVYKTSFFKPPAKKCCSPCAPCADPCATPCPVPCKKPCKKPRRCRVPCRPACYKPICPPMPCGSPCESPCPSPCTTPCSMPCRACCDHCRGKCSRIPRCSKPICPKPCRVPCRSSSPVPRQCKIPCKLICIDPPGPMSSCYPCIMPPKPACVLPAPMWPCRPKPCYIRYSTIPSLMPCNPCTLPCGTPCAPPRCSLPCCVTPCNPCRSSPCFHPCPVGYKRPRRCRSHPRVKPHKKLISPCCNRSRTCPVVRCRSVVYPCTPLPCRYPCVRKCASLCPPCKPSGCLPICS